MKKHYTTPVDRLAGRLIGLVAGLLASTVCTAPLHAEEMIIIEDEVAEDVIEISDDAEGDTLIIDSEESNEDANPDINADTVIVEEDELEIELSEPSELPGSPETDAYAVSDVPESEDAGTAFAIRLEKARLESAWLVEDNPSTDRLDYGHLTVSAEWKPNSPWAARAALRVDGYAESGSQDWDDVNIDYDDTYIRYRGESYRFTLGAQTLIWGRIDEIPPSDRLSVTDGKRFNLDDIAERKRARPMLRVERFADHGKYDFVYMPTFRAAELAEVESIWYPIDRTRRKILGSQVPTAVAATMGNATIINDEPDNDHAVGLRFSSSLDDLEYAMTLQHGRHTNPYFSYNIATQTFTAIYPRTFAAGADLAFEKNGITWRFEGVYLSEVPVTGPTLNILDAEAVNWAAGMEFYPGDADVRVNLQVAGNHLYNADTFAERTNIYNINGSVEIPFADNSWRANVRFFAGLDREDIYFNPKLSFVDWEPHELYVEAHYFDGADGTIGGFHEDHSLLAVGWRASF